MIIPPRTFAPAAALALGLAGCAFQQQAAAASSSVPARVLFVGNSITYVGNLPAVFDALAASQHRSVSSDMIVLGGATLANRAADGSVQRALDQTRYDYVVLQERGGDVLCAFGPKSCVDAVASLGRLARLSRAHGAKPIYLGTYQTNPRVSAHLVEAESKAAARWSVVYVPVSGRLQAGMKSNPSFEWLYADGMHPGHDLVLLEAVLLYRKVFGESPAAVALSVDAPMYAPNAKFASPSPVSKGASPDGIALDHAYSAPKVATVLAVAASKKP